MLWDLTWYERCGDLRFLAPVAVIEHEKSHDDDHFLDDFWKVMGAHAPLRVKIG